MNHLEFLKKVQNISTLFSMFCFPYRDQLMNEELIDQTENSSVRPLCVCVRARAYSWYLTICQKKTLTKNLVFNKTQSEKLPHSHVRSNFLVFPGTKDWRGNINCSTLYTQNYYFSSVKIAIVYAIFLSKKPRTNKFYELFCFW